MHSPASQVGNTPFRSLKVTPLLQVRCKISPRSSMGYKNLTILASRSNLSALYVYSKAIILADRDRKA